MIIFYTSEKPTITLSNSSVCDSICSSNCIKPKNKCCFKYKKKGHQLQAMPEYFFERSFLISQNFNVEEF